MAGTNTPSTADLAVAISTALEPVANAAGFDLEGVEVVPAGRRKLLRVIVDRDGGIDLDAVAEASREFGQVLDAGTVMGNAPYVLEVSSPGVDRPLTQPRHWRRATGRLVEVSLAEGTTVRGRVVDVTDSSVSLDVDGTTRDVPITDLGPGHVQLEFNRNAGFLGEGGVA